MDGESDIKLIGSWPSPFALRVRIALQLKSLTYEYIEENLLEPKSELIRKSNPIHNKVPVFIHNGYPICESQIIIRYIDEVWPVAPSIFPKDARVRAESQFWTAYIDDKMLPAMIAALIADSEDAKKAATLELEEGVMVMEGALKKLSKGKAFFNGDNIGYLDIAFGPIFIWIQVIEKFIECELLTEANTPLLLRWAHHSFSSHAAVKDLLPDPAKLAEYAVKLRPSLRARFASK